MSSEMRKVRLSAADPSSSDFEHDSGARSGWIHLTVILIVGYLSLSRSFAYLGLPPARIYIGELVLVAFLFLGPTESGTRWIKAVARAKTVQRLKWLILIFFSYGLFEAARGALQGFPLLTALRDTAFNYYPLYLALGIWVGLREKGFLRRLVPVLALWNGCYGILYLLWLNKLSWTMPGTANAASDVPLFTEPYGSAISILGLLTFQKKLARVWYLLLLNGIVMLWLQVRAEWLGFFIGLIVFAILTKQAKRLVSGFAVVLILLGVMYIADVELPSPEGRGGQFSTRDVVARAIAPFDKDFAADLSSSNDLQGYVGTAEWRLIMWAGIWGEVHSHVTTTILGLGYGYPIVDLNPLIEPGTFLQSPHSDFFYSLGYSGWAGVILFVLVQIEILRLLISSYARTRSPFGLILWCSLLTASLLEAFFETPFAAIPFFLIIGAAIAPGILPSRESSESGAEQFAASPSPA